MIDVDMGFDPPHSPAPCSDERELLLGFIRWQREQVVATAQGLTEDQLRWTPDGRLMSIGAVINHLTHMEWRWIEGRYLGSPFPARLHEFTFGEDMTAAGVIGAYWQQAQRTEALVRDASSLDAPCLGDEVAVLRTNCSASTAPSHFIGFSSISSRKRPITRATPTQPVNCSTARR